MTLTALYRGPLESCNYACSYCPFAKRVDDEAALARDRRALDRFVAWARGYRSGELAILFTPWGEALVRAWYRDAMLELAGVSHVTRVAAQTNLSSSLAFLDDVDDGVRARLALWASYHPTEVTLGRFVARCARVVERGVALSVGVVGLRARMDEIEALRTALPRDVYLWVNPVHGASYRPDDLARLGAVDPLFAESFAAGRSRSRGAPCRTGETAIAIDGDGVIRRCHFVDEILGTIDDPAWEDALRPRPCPRTSCACHIGHVHRKDLGLHERFSEGVVGRVLLPIVR